MAVADKSPVRKRKTKADASEVPVSETAVDTVERHLVTVPDRFPPGVTDQDVADEIEAEKVAKIAAILRAANTGGGVDEGIDADVREARALLAESRRQVRENVRLGEHYRAGDPPPKPPAPTEPSQEVQP